MQIEIWSDVVCPWCFIGKRRFEAALEKVTTGPDAITQPIEIIYRAYQLDPTAPANSSAPVREVYAKKFGGAERADKIIAQLTETAAQDGIEFRMDIGQRSNTILAHRMLWWTGVNHDYQVQADLKEALLIAYFNQGVNVGDAEQLVEIGVREIPRHKNHLTCRFPRRRVERDE
jgi:predicted DsbA family dithiol-disulfide isomerase